MEKKPYIAKDTKAPLVVLGGYRVARDGSVIRDILPPAIDRPKATPEDLRLLEKHGIEGLRELGFYGVLDRLSRRE